MKLVSGHFSFFFNVYLFINYYYDDDDDDDAALISVFSIIFYINSLLEPPKSLTVITELVGRTHNFNFNIKTKKKLPAYLDSYQQVTFAFVFWLFYFNFYFLGGFNH